MKRATKEERAWLGEVKLMRCMECRDNRRRQATITEVHHVRRYGSKRDHFKVNALCRDHHIELHKHHKAWIEREDKWLEELGRQACQ